MLARPVRTARPLKAAMLVVMATVLLAMPPANAAPVPYDIEVRTGEGKLEGKVMVERETISWDLRLEDTNKDDEACVYARIEIDRPTPPDNVFRSKDACFDEPVEFTGKDDHDHKGFTLEFCSRKHDDAPACIRVPTRL